MSKQFSVISYLGVVLTIGYVILLFLVASISQFQVQDASEFHCGHGAEDIDSSSGFAVSFTLQGYQISLLG